MQSDFIFINKFESFLNISLYEIKPKILNLYRMNMQELYEQVRQKNAARLYNQTARLIGARQDFLYLANERGVTPEIREMHERANQMANPLTCAHDMLNITGGLHMTVEEHMQTDPEICQFALDAVVWGIKEFGIEHPAAC